MSLQLKYAPPGKKRYARLLLRAVLVIIISALLSVQSSAQQHVNIPDFYDSSSCSIDSTAMLYIEKITVTGNSKTKSYIILREMLIRQGDSVIAGEIYSKLEHSRQLVYNTALFTDVEIRPSFAEPMHVTLNIIVTEKWFIYPIPQFQLADRNFNEWVNDYDASLSRVIYGLKFVHYNFSGRKDQLRVFLLNGYARNIAISYNNPYSNRALTEGFSFGIGYTQNREISYKTSYENKIQQFNNGSFVRNSFYLNGSYQIRKGFYKRTVLFMGYTHMKVTDSVVTKYNPDYFSTPDPSTGFPEFSYARYFTDVDRITYPLEGVLHFWAVTKRGWGIKGNNNFLALDGSYVRFLPHGKNWYSSFSISGKLKLPFDQPYINQRALGYGEFNLRGLEYYVVDGVAAVLGKYTVKKKLVSFKLPMPFRIKSIPDIPFTFFGKAYGDAGYCYNRPQFETRLNNRFLYTAGFGIDMLSVYDFSMRLEYSFNQLGEKGLFLHFKGGF